MRLAELLAGVPLKTALPPELATIAGVRQVLVFDGEGLGSFDAEKGNELWFHPWTQDPEVNVAQPLVFDDQRHVAAALSEQPNLIANEAEAEQHDGEQPDHEGQDQKRR